MAWGLPGIGFLATGLLGMAEKTSVVMKAEATRKESRASYWKRFHGRQRTREFSSLPQTTATRALHEIPQNVGTRRRRSLCSARSSNQRMLSVFSISILHPRPKMWCRSPKAAA
jgi:hypothetical protein